MGARPRTACLLPLLGLALLYASVMLVAGATGPVSWLDASLLDAAYSLVHDLTFSIEDTPFSTGDRLLIRGSMHASRLPLVQIAAATVYLPLHHLFGVDLGAGPSQTAIVYRSIAFALSVLPAIGSMILTCSLGLRWGLGRDRAIAAAAMTGFCTLVLPFGAVIGYHTLCAFLLVAALRLVDGGDNEVGSGRWRLAAAGFAAGLIPSVNAVTGAIVCLALLGGIIARKRPATVPFLAGLALAAALHVGLNLLATGRPLPFSVYRDFFEYPGSPFTDGNQFYLVKTLPISFYVWRATVGNIGFFSLSPVTLALAAISLWSWKRPLPPRVFGVYLATACLACFIFFLVVFPESIGWSYGPRHLISWYPLILLWGMLRLENPLPAGKKRLLAGVAVLSFLLCAPGVLEPFSREGFRRDGRALIPAHAPFAVLHRHFSSHP